MRNKKESNVRLKAFSKEILSSHFTIVTIFTLTVLTFISFWRVLFFGFWIDDWHLIWASLYNPAALHWYFNHPGLPIEFLVLSPVLRGNELLWELLGVFLHITIAFFVYLFVTELTNSKKAGFISSIFFAVVPFGIETISTPAANVSALATIPLLLGLKYFIVFLHKFQKYLWYSLTLLLIAFIFDPGRVIPVVLILVFLMFLFYEKKRIKKVKKIFYVITLGFIVLGLPLFFIWFHFFEPISLVSQALALSTKNPLFAFSKIKLFGNFFATVANIYIGIIYSLKQNDFNVAQYSKAFGRIGVGVLLVGVISLLLFLKTQVKQWGITAFFTFWTFLFYFPNWLDEPRAPMGLPHRYTFIAGIGFACLLGYLISLIQKRLWQGAFILAIIFLSVYKTNTILASQAVYRGEEVVRRIWQPMIAAVPTNETRIIFISYGDQPWLSQVVDLSHLGPFLLSRKVHTKAELYPIALSSDSPRLLELICSTNPFRLSQVYAWEIRSPGIAINKSEAERSLLRKEAELSHCSAKD